MSKMFERERLASESIHGAREQPPPPAPAAETEEAKLHLRLLEATDANINQLNSRLARFREDLNQLTQTMDASKAAPAPAPSQPPAAEPSSSGWYGRIVVFAIGLGIGAVVMMRNSTPEHTEPLSSDTAIPSPDVKTAMAVQQSEEHWDMIRRPVGVEPVKVTFFTIGFEVISAAISLA